MAGRDRIFRLYIEPDFDGDQIGVSHKKTILEPTGKLVTEEYPWEPRVFEPVVATERGTGRERTLYRLLSPEQAKSRALHTLHKTISG
jgi:hypothetical protein